MSAGGRPSISELLPTECWDLLKEDSETVLVDVRSKAEWSFVGTPDLSEIEHSVVFAEWACFPGMSANDQFVDDVEQGRSDQRTVIEFDLGHREGRLDVLAVVPVDGRHRMQCAGRRNGCAGELILGGTTHLAADGHCRKRDRPTLTAGAGDELWRAVVGIVETRLSGLCVGRFGHDDAPSRGGVTC